LKIKTGILKTQDAFLFILFIILFLFFSDIRAQDIFENKKGEFNNNSFPKLNLENEILNDSLKKSKNTGTFVMRKSPWKAVMYSALLPGLGQVYNESFWKVPVIAIVGGYLGYEIVRNNSKFIDYRNLYSNSQTTIIPDGDLILKQYREFYRNQRDQFILYFGLFYLINLVDAYVDAQMFDFDVSDNIKIGLDKDIGLRLNVNF
jgi:hypothetical protein